MSDDVKIVSIIAASLVSIILSCSVCSAHQSRQVTNMVQAGADPISAACAFTGSTKTECVLAAQRERGDRDGK